MKEVSIVAIEPEIKEILDSEYKENINVEDGIKLAIKAIRKVLGKEFDITRIDGAYIKIDENFAALKKRLYP